MASIEVIGTIEEIYAVASRVMGDDWADFLCPDPDDDWLNPINPRVRIGGADFLLFGPEYMRHLADAPCTDFDGNPMEPSTGELAAREKYKTLAEAGLYRLGFSYDMTAELAAELLAE